MSFSKTFSITFGDVAENHKGMQKVGNLSDCGFNLDDLNRIKDWFESKGSKCNIVNLHWLLEEEDAQAKNPAYILIIKNAVNSLLESEEGANLLFKEQDVLPVLKPTEVSFPYP
jgi:hypothetical protein